MEGFLVEDEVFFACRRCDARFDDAASLVPIVSIDLATFYFGGRLRALAVLVGLFCSAGLLAAGLLRL
ncbi:MAG TPA: hypothetical protein VM681_02495 [Candidatus Thermoplasmatota archaeon]|nr:hypothetical protein [Candidatus Thermoplasmatota archaeon]